MSRRNRRRLNQQAPLFPFLRKPAGQLAVVLLVAFIVIMIALSAGGGDSRKQVSVDDAFTLYQNGIFVLDVSWPAEWDEYHLPSATLIPLDQLYNRYGELPKDRRILIVSRSQTSSQQAQDFLEKAGFNTVSMAGSLSEWYEKGYPIEGAPPQ
jgi:rhodanese-related sulfurtransferase